MRIIAATPQKTRLKMPFFLANITLSVIIGSHLGFSVIEDIIVGIAASILIIHLIAS